MIQIYAIVAAVVLLVGGLAGWRINDAAFDRGEAHDRTGWIAAEAVASAAALKLANERDAATASATTAGTLAQSAVAALAQVKAGETRTYYEAHPAAVVACLNDDRVRAIAASDAAALAAAATARVVADPLHDHPAVVGQ
ncbi:MAG: hypothetical protein ACRYG4_04205 [Janthinobacterium lividum]